MKFFRNVLETFTTEVVIVGLNFLVGVIVARLLPLSERGVLALVMLLPVTLAYFADVGISQAIIYLLGRKKRAPEVVLGNGILFALLLGGGTALGMWLLRGVLVARGSSFLNDIPVAYFGMVLALLPLLLVDTYLLSLLRGQQRFGLFNLRRLLTPLFLLAGVGGLVGWAGWGLGGAVWAFVISTLLSLVISVGMVGQVLWGFGRRESGFDAVLRTGLNPRGGLRFDRQVAREALGFGVKSYLQNLVGHLNYRLDVYLLALFLPPAQVAFYAVATAVAEVSFYIPDSVGTVLFPRLTAESEERIHSLTAEVSRHTLLITALASLGILLVGGLLIPLVYGPEYQPAVAPLFVLMPGILAMAIYKVLTRNFTSRNRQQVSILAAGVALVLNVTLNIFLIPRLGVVGAALASLLSYTASATVLLLVFRRETGMGLQELLIFKRSDLARYAQLQARIRARLRALMHGRGAAHRLPGVTRYAPGEKPAPDLAEEINLPSGE